MTKSALAVRHVAFEDPGVLGDLLAARGYTLSIIEAPVADWSNLDLTAPDLVISLGGPIGVYEADAYPFLRDEIAAVAARMAADRPTLGLCLGAQVMTAACGAPVTRGAVKEIGYAPLTLTEAGQASVLSGLSHCDFNVLHWHGDQMAAPEGAEILAHTAATPVQAWSKGARQLALQFHMEVPPEAVPVWCVGHAMEIAATPGVTPGGLRDHAKTVGPHVAAAGREVLGAWLDEMG